MGCIYQLEADLNQKEIALEIGIHPSTISREFNNDKVRAYSAKIVLVLDIDTVVGKNHKVFLVTVEDRKSKFTLMKNIVSKHAKVATQALIEIITPLKKISHTIRVYTS